MSTAFNDWLDANIGETCCGQCEADTCYVDYITGEKEQSNERYERVQRVWQLR